MGIKVIKTALADSHPGQKGARGRKAVAKKAKAAALHAAAAECGMTVTKFLATRQQEVNAIAASNSLIRREGQIPRGSPNFELMKHSGTSHPK